MSSSSDITLGLAAFIDLLGFSDMVKSTQTEKELYRAIEKIEFIKAQFTQTQKLDTEGEIFHSRRKYFYFSDCIIIDMPDYTPRTETLGSYDAMMGYLREIAIGQGTCVLEGIFLRGGIGKGFTYSSEDVLVSPSMVKAYDAEKVSCFPIITFTDEASKYLLNHEGRSAYAPDWDPANISITDKIMGTDNIERYYLDYLYINIIEANPEFLVEEKIQHDAAHGDEKNDLYWSAKTRGRRKFAKDHGEMVQHALAAATSEKVRKKYEWLCSYHNRTVRAYLGDDVDDLLIEVPETA
ncbi:MAG: hypothetical protein ACPGOV_08595 [Magnetovibrionaceae bacterium]